MLPCHCSESKLAELQHEPYCLRPTFVSGRLCLRVIICLRSISLIFAQDDLGVCPVARYMRDHLLRVPFSSWLREASIFEVPLSRHKPTRSLAHFVVEWHLQPMEAARFRHGFGLTQVNTTELAIPYDTEKANFSHLVVYTRRRSFLRRDQ